jgi:hypothetical protein
MFLVPALGAGAIVYKGWRVVESEPEWGRVLMTWGAALALLFVVPLFLRTAARINLLISLISVGLCLLAFNVFLTYQDPPHLALVREADRIRMQQPGADARMPFAVARDLTKEGKPTVPFLVGRIARRAWKPGEILPLAGVATATTALCNENGPYVFFTSDEHGFRNPPGRFTKSDVVIVGDSFAQGECVPRGKDVASLLRASGHQALSLGASGSGPLIELAIQIEYAQRLEPKTLVWLFFEENDLEDLWEELENPLLVRYLEDDSFSQNLWDKQPEIDAYWHKFLAEVKPTTYYGDSMKTHELLTLTPLRRLVRLERRAHAPWRRDLRRILTTSKRLMEERGGRLLFVYLPGWSRYGTRPALDKAEVFEIVRTLGIPSIDFDEALRASGDPLAHFPSRHIGHYNELGHALLAKTIAEAVK